MEHYHQPRSGIRMGQDRINIRQPVTVKTDDIDKAPMRYVALALVHLRNLFAKLPTMVEDFSKPVDEYRPMSLSGESTSLITVQPQWETGEIIKSILVNGPVSTAFTLQLGDRTLNLVTNAQGYFYVGPIAMILDRSDVRQLSSATAGDWMVELMGNADTRTQLV